MKWASGLMYHTMEAGSIFVLMEDGSIRELSNASNIVYSLIHGPDRMKENFHSRIMKESTYPEKILYVLFLLASRFNPLSYAGMKVHIRLRRIDFLEKRRNYRRYRWTAQ